MRNSIDTYIKSIAHDNAEYITTSVADYIISDAESSMGWQEFFDDSELDETGEPSEEQIEEMKDYLSNNYSYLSD